MEKLNLKSLAISLGVVVLVAAGVVGLVASVKAFTGQLFGDCNNCTINIPEAAQEVLGAITDARPARLLTLNYLNVLSDSQFDGAVVFSSTTSFTGAITASGGITGPLTTSNLSTAVTTTTLATTDSGKVYNITSSTNFVLPSTSTNAGVWYRFVIGGAITSNVTIQTSDGGNDIEGAMIVAGAVVDCDAEDTITFVADGENIGDFIELYGNGTDWLIGSSGALTSGKMTCSTSI